MLNLFGAEVLNRKIRNYLELWKIPWNTLNIRREFPLDRRQSHKLPLKLLTTGLVPHVSDRVYALELYLTASV